MRWRRRGALVAALACCLSTSCRTQDSGSGAAASQPAAARGDPLLARHTLEQGRALLQEGRSESAVRVLRRGTQLAPQDAALQRALARALEAQGLSDEAAATWAHADALHPPPPPLPQQALADSRPGLLIALLPSAEDDAHGSPHWPEPEVEAALGKRLARRLPHARLLRADPGSVGAARQWLASQQAQRALSLAVERSWCGFTVKDGKLAVARLRVATAAPGLAFEARSAGVALEEPRGPDACPREAIARALEAALALPEVQQVLASQDSGGEWSREALRALFPGIARQLHEALRSGRALLAAGDLSAAQRAFEQAATIDPGDEEVRSSLADTALTLELALELEARQGGGSGATLEPRLSAARRAAAEQALADERRRRDELLATLAVLDEDLRPPPLETLEALHHAELGPNGRFGARLARERTSGEIELRIAFAPDGSELARYYVARADGAPLVREEDTNGDTAPDRWITYRGAARSEIFEAGASGAWGSHFVFGDGGEPLLRVELDASGDGQPERVLRYAAGRLQAEQIDSDGDGRLDRFDRFDATGGVAERSEDLDGDGTIDVHSVYESGRLQRRELSDPALPES